MSFFSSNALIIPLPAVPQFLAFNAASSAWSWMFDCYRSYILLVCSLTIIVCCSIGISFLSSTSGESISSMSHSLPLIPSIILSCNIVVTLISSSILSLVAIRLTRCVFDEINLLGILWIFSFLSPVYWCTSLLGEIASVRFYNLLAIRSFLARDETGKLPVVITVSLKSSLKGSMCHLCISIFSSDMSLVAKCMEKP